MRKQMTFLFVQAAFFTALCLPQASIADDMTPAYGPKQYTRNVGKPQNFTDTFPHCGTAGCQIVMINGNPDGNRPDQQCLHSPEWCADRRRQRLQSEGWQHRETCQSRQQ